MKDGAPKNRLRELRDRSRLTLQEVSVDKYARLYKVRTYELFIDPREAGDAAVD